MRKKKNHTQVLAEEKVRISPYSFVILIAYI
jgi:hypothetical protein